MTQEISLWYGVAERESWEDGRGGSLYNCFEKDQSPFPLILSLWPVTPQVSLPQTLNFSWSMIEDSIYLAPGKDIHQAGFTCLVRTQEGPLCSAGSRKGPQIKLPNFCNFPS